MMLERSLAGGASFELIQAVGNVFLRVHAEALIADVTLLAPLKRLADAQEDAWRRLEALFHETTCLVDFARNAPVS